MFDEEEVPAERPTYGQLVARIQWIYDFMIGVQNNLEEEGDVKTKYLVGELINEFHDAFEEVIYQQDS
jgi:hypothetical protein